MRVFFAFLLCITAFAAEQQFAHLGNFRLSSGEVIRDCRIGYRTWGTLNADKSNAILFPTWAGGRTEQLEDTVKGMPLKDYFVIGADAFSNGVSSSPSNSRLQPRMQFPKVAIRDMATAEHDLLTHVLHIGHLKAVMGISMGGMQTFQWMVQYPDFMDKAIPIVGSPRLAPYDLMDWQAQIDALTDSVAWNGGNYKENPAPVSEAEYWALVLTTPEHYNAHTTRQQALESIAKARHEHGGVDANDKIRQCQAMMSMDVSEEFGGQLDKAAAAVKAKALIIVARQDHVVTPGPALEFARYLHAQTVELEDDCGHLASSCEADKVAAAVGRFLSE